MARTRAAIVNKEPEGSLRAWNTAGMTCIRQNCGEESSDPLRLMKRLARFIYLTDHLQASCLVPSLQKMSSTRWQTA